MRIGLVAAAILFSTAAHGAEQEIISLDRMPEAMLRMVVPAGFCQVDPDGTEAERQEFLKHEALIESRRLLALFMDCVSYGGLGIGFAGNASTLRVVTPLRDGMPISYEGQNRRAAIDAHMAGLTEDGLAAGAANTGAAMGVTDAKLELLGRDNVAFYTRFTAREVIGGDTIFHVATLSGLTIVQDYLIGFGRSGRSIFPEIHEQLGQEVQEIVQEFVWLNEQAASSTPPEAVAAGEPESPANPAPPADAPEAGAPVGQIPSATGSFATSLLQASGDPTGQPSPLPGDALVPMLSEPAPWDVFTPLGEGRESPGASATLQLAAAFAFGLLAGVLGLHLARRKRA